VTDIPGNGLIFLVSAWCLAEGRGDGSVDVCIVTRDWPVIAKQRRRKTRRCIKGVESSALVSRSNELKGESERQG
jgi:hypothetical protein